jgi:hypothetical protein
VPSPAPGGAALSMDSLLEQFSANQRQQQQHQQQQIAPFQLPPTQITNNTSAFYSSDSLQLRGKLASLQAVMKLQQQQTQQFQEHKWQEEERQRKRQLKLAQEQQLWLRQQVPHHPQNLQIISENRHLTAQPQQTRTTQQPATASSNVSQLLAMVAALQSQSSYPSR